MKLQALRLTDIQETMLKELQSALKNTKDFDEYNNIPATRVFTYALKKLHTEVCGSVGSGRVAKDKVVVEEAMEEKELKRLLRGVFDYKIEEGMITFPIFHSTDDKVFKSIQTIATKDFTQEEANRQFENTNTLIETRIRTKDKDLIIQNID